ncbi:beta strand repeat-containing protein, partial [Flavobacterium sp.]|uniref:beta strand repeat-containing protein n=1 Tax=Flavobacterium sp. TaxID=239 RepID=UPI003BDBFEC3
MKNTILFRKSNALFLSCLNLLIPNVIMEKTLSFKKFFNFFQFENKKPLQLLNIKMLALTALIVINVQQSWGQTAQSVPYSSPTGFGSASLTSANGWTTGTALGSNYTDTTTPLKFDGTGKFATLFLASAPGTLTYYLKGNGFTVGTFTISESANGSTFTTLRTVTTLATTNVLYTDTPLSTTRYIKWTFTTKSNGNVGVGTISIAAFGLSAPPSITAATGATVDAPFDVTFTDANSWSTSITGVTVGGTTLATGAYSVGTNKITFTPSASTLLQSPGAKSIVVSATGFSTATVSQTIGVGAAAKLVITQQPTAPTYNRGVLAQQPIVAIQDQYGNATTSTASVTAAPTNATWDIGGSNPESGSSSTGLATFTNLTAKTSLAVALTNATITFSSPGLTSVTSNEFIIPVITIPATNALTISTCSSTVFDPGGTSNYASNTSSGALLLNPSTTGAMVRITFNTFNTESGFDFLYVYNGNSTSAAQVTGSPFSGTSIPAAITSSAADGSLTLVFTSDSSTNASGFDFTVSCAPLISTTGTLAAVNTTYGTASETTTFNVAGLRMTAGILVTPPTGFEVSLSSSGPFTNTVTVGSAGTIASTPVYVRLAASTVVGSYSGNIVLSSTASTSATIATVSSTISKANSSITATGTSTYIYNGTAQGPATNTKSGSTGAVTYSYSGTDSTTYAASATAPTAVGTYQVIATVAADSNYNTASSSALAFSITKANSSITTTGTSTYIYNGTAQGPATNTKSGSSGAITYSYSGTDSTTYADSATAPTAVGTYQVIATVAEDANYNSVSSSPLSFSISQKALTITGLTAEDKIYDESTTATISGTATLNGVVGSEDVTLTGSPTATFASSAVGVGISVAVTGYSLTGAAVANYTLTQPTLSASIISNTPTLFASGTLAAVNATYGSASATPSSFSVSGQSLTNAISVTAPTGFEVSLSSASGYASSVSVGAAGNVSSTNVYVRLAATNAIGSYSGNIEISSTDATTLTIATSSSIVSQKQLTISGLTGVDKTYNNSTDASVSGTAELIGIVGSEDVSLNSSAATYAFANANVGTNKSITVLGYALNGTASSNYTLAQPIGITASINKADQTISAIAESQTITFGDAPYSIATTATSGLTVAYSSSNTSVATVATNGLVTIVGAGTATITASQSGNSNYNAATPVTQVVTVAQANQTITAITLSVTKTYGDATYSIATTATSGLTVTYSSDNTSVVTVAANGLVTIVGAGIANITAAQAGNTNYNAASSLTQEVTVGKADQTITLAPTLAKTTATTSYTLTQNASSGLAVVYSSSNSAVATTIGNTVTIVGTGTTIITATQEGDANYNAAEDATQNLTVTLPECASVSGTTSYNFGTATPFSATPSSTQSNVTVSAVTQGNSFGASTLLSSTSTSSVYAGASGSGNAGIAAKIGALDTSTTTNAYFSFTVTPELGYNFTLNGISFGSRSTGTGPQAYSLRSSLDNYATDIATGSISNNSAWALKANTGLTVTGNGNANPVTFRLYGYSGTGSPSSSSVNWRIDDLALSISTSNTPSAATVAASQSVCGLTSTALGGNTPAIGTGTWSQVSGPGTSTFSATNSGSSTATASVEGTYVYRWSISNGCATTNTADVTVSYTVATSNTNTIAECGTYTWPVNGQTYTTSGSYSKVTGCFTEILNLTITPNVTPTFDSVAAVCSGTSLTALPTISTNEITGTWSSELDNTTTKEYTFTPTAGQCATTATLTITVNPTVTPTFDSVAAVCSGTSLTALPTISTNEITGTWSSELDNTTTKEYTFTPTAGQCATTATLTITVNPTVTPTFDSVAAVCSGTSLTALPT